MAYKNELQLAYSGREIALQRIEIINSTVFEDETEKNYSDARREKYQKLLEKSDERIAEIKSRIAEDISAKKLQLEEYKTEYSHVSTRHKLGEISLQECEKQQNIFQKKYDRLKQDAAELDRLLATSNSSEIGGQIPIDIDKDVDDYGNINRKAVGLNIPSDMKMPNIDAFSNVKDSVFDAVSNINQKAAGLNIPNDMKMPNIDAFSNVKDSVFDAVSNVNMPSSISTQGMNLSRGNLISLLGSAGGILSIFLPWVKATQWGGGGILAGGWTVPLHQLSMIGDVFRASLPLVNSFYSGLGIDNSAQTTAILASTGALSYYWLILLPLLIVCVYFSIRGRGGLTHIGVGLIQLGILFVIYTTLSPYMPKQFLLEYGFYLALLLSFVLIFGGITELREG
jgi:hypothetical protein